MDEKDKKIKELEEALEKEKKAHEKTKKEYQEFKAKHTQTVTELRKALKIKADKIETPKPAGAKNGHKTYNRHIPTRIDCVKEHKLSRCPECRTQLGATQEISQRYVTDVKLVSRVRNTRHDIHRKY